MRMRAHFLLSAFAPEHFPAVSKTANAPEVAFLGRSNVGKSSLINALVGQEMARVSSTPGRTRSINFFALNEVSATGVEKAKPSLVFADLPGYGYAKISKSISAEWGSFIDPYLNDREQLALCCCLVDTNIPPQEIDHQLIEYLKQTQRGYLVLGTKSDRLSNNALAKSVAALKREHGIDELIPIAAKDGKTGRGMKQLWERLGSLTAA